jgi:hypothetical protein
VATQLSCDVPAEIEYPSGEYAGEITLAVRFRKKIPASSIIHLALRYQPCNVNACFAAITKHFEAKAP